MKVKHVVSVGVCAAALVAGVLAGDIIGSKSPGTWTRGNFAQVNLGCMQAWVCTAPDVMHTPETVVKTTVGVGAAGICNAGGGDVTSCNVCASNPPTQACEYWLEKK